METSGLRIPRAASAYPSPVQTPILTLTSEPPPARVISVQPVAFDPGELMRNCLNCGSAMEERKCKLICIGCGYFLSCSDYY